MSCKSKTNIAPTAAPSVFRGMNFLFKTAIGFGSTKRCCPLLLIFELLPIFLLSDLILDHHFDLIIPWYYNWILESKKNRENANV